MFKFEYGKTCRNVLFFFLLQNLDAPSLQNISFTLNSNKLLAVIGPVGAGKVGYIFVSSYRVRKKQH